MHNSPPHQQVRRRWAPENRKIRRPFLLFSFDQKDLSSYFVQEVPAEPKRLHAVFHFGRSVVVVPGSTTFLSSTPSTTFTNTGNDDAGCCEHASITQTTTLLNWKVRALMRRATVLVAHALSKGRTSTRVLNLQCASNSERVGRSA